MKKVPWTHEEVRNLNDYQNAGYLHPYTCNDGHDLVATTEGWVCDKCEEEGKPYKQDWCLAWMADGSWRKNFAESARLYSDPRVQKLLATLKNIDEEGD